MKTQLIIFPDQRMILVSDEEQKKGDPIFHKSYMNEFQNAPDEYGSTQEHWWKIIAGIPELPSIDFSALSEEDCKKIGWVDVEKICNDLSIGSGYELHEFAKKMAIKGFQVAQSLNEKKYGEKEVRELMSWAASMAVGKRDSGSSYSDIASELERKIQTLSQPKVFDVIIEETRISVDSTNNNGIFDKYIPVITNNSIKVIAIK